jgi:hypothetical protein
MKLKHLSVLFFCLVINACSTSSRQIVGVKRPPIDTSQVTIYTKKPLEYEQIAFIQASSKNAMAFSDEAMQDVIIERLKEEAAALGANGVLLNQTEEQVTGSIGSGTGMSGGNFGIGIGFSIPITNQSTRAVAIYVAPPMKASATKTQNTQSENPT